MSEYNVGFKALQYGVIDGFDLSLEAANIKLMWTIAHFPYEEIKAVMQKNLAGEKECNPLPFFLYSRISDTNAN